MNDPLKRTLQHQEFSGENIKKVPAFLHFQEDFGPMFFHLAFVNLEIIAAHLLKSNEWIYGIYEGQNYKGYLYFGENLKLDLQTACIKDFLPLNRNNLQEFVNRWNNKVEYHNSAADSFRYIGEIDSRKVYQKPKQLKDNI